MKTLKRILLILALLGALANVYFVLSGNTHIYKTLRLTVFKGTLGPALDENPLSTS